MNSRPAASPAASISPTHKIEEGVDILQEGCLTSSPRGVWPWDEARGGFYPYFALQPYSQFFATFFFAMNLLGATK